MRIVHAMRSLVGAVMALLCTLALPACGGTCSDVDVELRTKKGQARALAIATGCAAVERCDALPMGVRACGGPQEFVVFCRDSTDVAALESSLAEIDRLEHGFNQACGIGSTCILLVRPELTLVEGRCEPLR